MITLNNSLYAYLMTTTMQTQSCRPLYRGKHNYYTITVDNSLKVDLNTNTIRPSSRQPLYRKQTNYHTIQLLLSRQLLFRCNYNYYTITVDTCLQVELNTNAIQPSSRRPLCKNKNNYHTIQLLLSRRLLFKCNHNYYTITVDNSL